MPRNTREWAKRELDAAVKNLEWGGTHVYAVVEKYDEKHKEVSSPLIDTLKVIEQIQDLIQKVRASF